MNLQGMAAGATRIVSAATPAALWQSTGKTMLPSGRPVPGFALNWGMVDVQGVKASMLQHLADLNITGVMRQVWLRGDWESVVRASLKGGDLFVFGGFEWKVVLVAETWDASEWCSVIVVQTQARALPSMQGGAAQTVTLGGTASQDAALPFLAAWADGAATGVATLASGPGTGITVTPGTVQVAGNGSYSLPVHVATASAPSGTSVYTVTISGGGASCTAELSVVIP